MKDTFANFLMEKYVNKKKKREKRSDRKVRKFEKFNSIIHYENITNISPVLNHDLRVPLKEDLGEYLLIGRVSTESAADQAWMMIAQPE